MAALGSHSLGSLHDSRGVTPGPVVLSGPVGARQFLLVMTVDSLAIEPLPARGQLIIGRSKSADLRLEDPAVSGRHLRLTLGDRLTVEDLGSAGGTRIAGVTLVPRTATEILPGEAIALGATVLMVRETTTSERPQRIWSHAPFRLRVDEECERAGRSGAVFTLVRLLVEAPAVSETAEGKTGAEADLIWGLLAAHAPPPHAAGMYGAREYELLLVGMRPAQAAERVAALQRALGAEGCVVRAGLAGFPEDGRSSAALLARANAHLFESRGAGAPAVGPAAGSAPSGLCLDQADEDLITAAACHDRPLLLVGEAGTGKETLARVIHARGARAQAPFCVVEAAGRSAAELERELFGEPSDHPGAWASAARGTLFIADADWLPTATLLHLAKADEGWAPRLIMTRTSDVPAVLSPLGSNLCAPSDRRRQLRRDPGSLLGATELTVAPLRDRPAHLSLLIDCLMENAAAARGRGPIAMTPDGRAWLEHRTWPGNVRELQNVIDHTVAAFSLDGRAPDRHSDREPLDEQHRGPEWGGVAPDMRATVAEVLMQTPDVHAGSLGGERDRIMAALAACAFNQSRAAARLGISRRTLVARLGQFGIDRPLKHGI
jgi:two-component system response regulator AtoC